MCPIGQAERVTQNRVIKLFVEELGYRYLGDFTDNPNNSNVEEKLLSAYLSKQGYSAAQFSRALDRIRVEASNPRALSKSTTCDFVDRVDEKRI